MVRDAERVGLDTTELARQLACSLASSRQWPTPPREEQLRELIDTAFFASLEREEGRFARPAVALVTEGMMAGDGANRKDWSPLRFVKPMKFDISTVVKLAPAVDYRQTLIAVMDVAGQLAITGVIRTNTMVFASSRGESAGASGTSYDAIVVSAVDVGTICIDVGWCRFARISKGAVEAVGTAVLVGGPVSAYLGRNAHVAGLNSTVYFRVLHRTLNTLRDRGHGGTILMVPDNDLDHLRSAYALSQPSTAIQDAVRFGAGERLGPTVEVTVGVAGKPDPDPKTVEIERACRRALEQREFEADAVRFAADLASIDGALVLGPDLTILAIGAHITCQDDASVSLIYDLNATGMSLGTSEASPLAKLGTRHNSAARFCQNRTGALAFVVSQDGVASCMLRTAADSVTLWRPLALEVHWRWPSGTSAG